MQASSTRQRRRQLDMPSTIIRSAPASSSFSSASSLSQSPSSLPSRKSRPSRSSFNSTSSSSSSSSVTAHPPESSDHGSKDDPRWAKSSSAQIQHARQQQTFASSSGLNTNHSNRDLASDEEYSDHDESESDTGRDRSANYHDLQDDDNDANNDDLMSDPEPGAFNEVSQLGTTHYLPLVFVALPLIGGALVGKADWWRDVLVLVVVVWWMWFLIKTPWELYHESLHHSLLIQHEPLTDMTEADSSTYLLAQTSLGRLNNFYLLLTLLAPALGSILLHMTRSALTEGDQYINSFNIRLFLLASSVKPVLNFVDILKNRNHALKNALGKIKPTEADKLNKRIKQLETLVRDLEHEKAGTKDVAELRAALVDGTLGDLNKAVKRQERRGELVRLTLGERVDLLSASLASVQNELAQVQAQRSSLSWLLRLLHLSSSSSSAARYQHLYYTAAPKKLQTDKPQGPLSHLDRAETELTGRSLKMPRTVSAKRHSYAVYGDNFQAGSPSNGLHTQARKGFVRFLWDLSVSFPLAIVKWPFGITSRFFGLVGGMLGTGGRRRDE